MSAKEMKRIKKKYLGKRYDKYEKRGDLHWTLYNEMKPSKPETSYKIMIDDSIAPFRGCSGTILDVGCGDGLVASILVWYGLKVTGVDSNKIGLDILQEKVRGVKCYNEKIEDFVKRDLKYDYMVCIDVIEHLKDPQVIVDMMAKVKKFAIITTDNDWCLTKVSEYHTRQFIPEEFKELFKDYKLESIPMRVKYFFSYKIYAK